jgi:N-6 DNA Methylase
VKFIVEVIEPYHGAIFDPACGSGGMFVHSAEFVRRHHRAPQSEFNIFGIEKMAGTLRLCRLNREDFDALRPLIHAGLAAASKANSIALSEAQPGHRPLSQERVRSRAKGQLLPSL